MWVDECLESGRRVADASGPARVVPALRVVDEPAAQEDEALLEAELAAVEDSLSTPFAITFTASGGTLSRRSASSRSWGEMQIRASLRSAAARRRSAQWSPKRQSIQRVRARSARFSGIEPVACRQATGLLARGHPCEIGAERGGERGEAANPVEHLQLSAVQVRDDGAIGPATGDGIVERRQVVQVEEVGAVEASADKHVLPGVRLVLGELR